MTERLRDSLNSGDIIYDQAGYPVIQHGYGGCAIFDVGEAFDEMLSGEMQSNDLVSIIRTRNAIKRAYFSGAELPPGATVIPQAINENI